jgi:hypothetical protein
MEEIVPGVIHWTATHPNIRKEVSSYLLVDEGVLLDPLEPPEGLDAVAERAAPTAVVLTNRHHRRHTAHFRERFGCSVHASRPGAHEFGEDDHVELFDFGDELPGGLVAYEVGAICPDETAVWVPRVKALACADGVVRWDGQPGFVPDALIGDDPEPVKDGLRAAYRRLADELEPEHLLLAHGDPVVGGAAGVLRGL